MKSSSNVDFPLAQTFFSDLVQFENSIVGLSAGSDEGMAHLSVLLHMCDIKYPSLSLSG